MREALGLHRDDPAARLEAHAAQPIPRQRVGGGLDGRQRRLELVRHRGHEIRSQLGQLGARPLGAHHQDETDREHERRRRADDEHAIREADGAGQVGIGGADGDRPHFGRLPRSGCALGIGFEERERQRPPMRQHAEVADRHPGHHPPFRIGHAVDEPAARAWPHLPHFVGQIREVVLAHPRRVDREADHFRQAFAVDVGICQLRDDEVMHLVAGMDFDGRQLAAAARIGDHAFHDYAGEVVVVIDDHRKFPGFVVRGRPGRQPVGSIEEHHPRHPHAVRPGEERLGIRVLGKAAGNQPRHVLRPIAVEIAPVGRAQHRQLYAGHVAGERVHQQVGRFAGAAARERDGRTAPLGDRAIAEPRQKRH